MSDSDAYRDEMRLSSGLSDRDVERLLSGCAVEDEWETEELAGFLRDLRTTYTEPPARAIEGAHLSRITKAARSLADGRRDPAAADQPGIAPAKHSSRGGMITRRRLVVLTAGFAAGALLASAGLAAAGVSLPAVARAPFERVGIELPNQGAAGDVHAVIDAPTDQRGCAFGQAVARAATGGKAGPSGDPCLRQNGEGGQDPGSAPHDSSADQGAGRAFGQRTAADAQASASQDGRAFGERTSQDAQELGQGEPATDGTPGQEHSQSGDAIANEQSEAGQAIGQQHSENGASPQTGSPTGGGGSGGSQPSSGGAP